MSSTFEVVIRKLDTVTPHPNADKLDVVQIGGYNAVVGKDTFRAGDSVLYVPEDAVFTDLSVAIELGCHTYLTGKESNRVKAIRLRGIVSQGICIPLVVFKKYLYDINYDINALISEDFTGKNWAEILKIEKYEEPIPMFMDGIVRPWPSFLYKYDVDNIKRPESMATMIEGEIIVATEKLHGFNASFSWGPGLADDEDLYVCSHNRALKESPENIFWKIARQYDMDLRLHTVKTIWEEIQKVPVESVAIYGEIVGSQDLKYGASSSNPVFYPFDICINGKYVSYDQFFLLCHMTGIRPVPEVYRGPYSYDKLKELSSGKTTLNGDHIREGLVIRTVTERQSFTVPRVQFKFISDDYLVRKGGTEFH